MLKDTVLIPLRKFYPRNFVLIMQTIIECPLLSLDRLIFYGIHQSNHFLITQLIESAKSKSNTVIYDLDAKRDYLWVGDLVKGIIKVISMQKESLNIYNIGSGKTHSAREIINIISTHIPSIQHSITSNGGKLLIQDCICDNSLFSKDFSWHPKISLEDGIARILKHIK